MTALFLTISLLILGGALMLLGALDEELPTGVRFLTMLTAALLWLGTYPLTF